MAAPLQFRVLSSTGRYRHLGAVERGLRTACGRTFEANKTSIDKPGHLIYVTCLACMATNDYARAVVAQAVEDKRARS